MNDTAVLPETVVLVGNRNVGKTTLFNGLTGLRQKVGNYPGVTVERRAGRLRGHEDAFQIIDLPGITSLRPDSPDEQVAAEVLSGERGEGHIAAAVVVLDATQLRRGLYLLSQVLEFGLRTIVCVNMADEARREGIDVHCKELSEALGGIPVVETVGLTGAGIDQLIETLREDTAKTPGPELVEVPGIQGLPEPSRLRWSLLQQGLEEADLAGQDVQARWAWVRRIQERARVLEAKARRHSSDRLDRFLLHPLLGPLAFVLIMGTVFQAVFGLAQAPMEWIEGAVGALGETVLANLGSSLATDLLANGVIGGVGSVLVFLPQILILFFFIGLLEDTGYMTRAAFLVDRPLRAVGLSGQAFIPLLSSFACAIPGIMATRTIGDRKERFLTIMVAPLMTCSARLPVYSILIAAFIPEDELLGGLIGLRGLVLLSLYLGGMALAAAAALIMNLTLFRGQRRSSILEMPPYRRPLAGAVLMRLRHRAMGFLKRAGTVILVMSLAVWVLMTFPRSEADPALSEREAARFQVESSFGGRLGKTIEPVIEPLGYDWRLGIGIVGSLAAREVLISTMGVVYAVGEEDESGLVAKMKSARWPDGRPVYTLPVVLGLLVFYMVALQCVSTIVVTRRETASWAWAGFQFGWMTVLAYVLAFLTRVVAEAAGL